MHKLLSYLVMMPVPVELTLTMSLNKIRIVFILFMSTCLMVFVASFTITVPDDGCSINIKQDFTQKHPLILKENSNEFIIPTNGPNILFTTGEKLILSCPGIKNKIKVTTAQEISVKCIKNQIFTLTGDKTYYKFKDLECLNYPESIARRTNNKCGSNFTEFEIGFNVTRGFISLIKVCFDEMNAESLYSSYNLSSNIKNQQSIPRPKKFKKDFFIFNPAVLFKRKNQINRFAEILKSRKLAEKYISLNTSDFYVTKGHLTAKSDFMYGSQQRATFFYINIAPQWQTFNGRNWNLLENSCRNFASKAKINLTVYTGVFGNAKLPDEEGNLQDLSLSKDLNNNNLLRVPEIYWKLLHDPVCKRGIVFVGHNNPYETNITKFCTDVCDKIKWLSWKAENVTAGISYCCEYKEFKNIVSYLPDVDINSLLV